MTTSSPNRVTIPARRGKAALLRKGQHVKVINTHGQQVIDTWAFARADLTELMSMEHTRTAVRGVMVRVGTTLVTNRRRPILTLVKDTSPGVHDTLIASCDLYRYEQLGAVGYHDNCTDNLEAALEEIGVARPETPSPLNLFQNTPLKPDGSLTFEPSVAKPGDYVVFRAEMDCIVVFSACPQDMIPISGVNMTPREAHFEVF